MQLPRSERLESPTPEGTTNGSGIEDDGEWGSILNAPTQQAEQRRCARAGFQRVYELGERVLAAPLLNEERTDEEGHVALIRAAGKALSVATALELISYLVPRSARLLR